MVVSVYPYRTLALMQEGSHLPEHEVVKIRCRGWTITRKTVYIGYESTVYPEWTDHGGKLTDDLERVMGIEPTLSAWEAEVLPLNYTRVFLILLGYHSRTQPDLEGTASPTTGSVRENRRRKNFSNTITS